MPVNAMDGQIQAHGRPDETAIGHATPRHACLVLGTTISASAWRAAEVIAASTSQAQGEGGFRLLKDPLFWVASVCVKKPCRIHGVLMVMTLALLVDAVAQRRWRQP